MGVGIKACQQVGGGGKGQMSCGLSRGVGLIIGVGFMGRKRTKEGWAGWQGADSSINRRRPEVVIGVLAQGLQRVTRGGQRQWHSDPQF